MLLKKQRIRLEPSLASQSAVHVRRKDDRVSVGDRSSKHVIAFRRLLVVKQHVEHNRSRLSAFDSIDEMRYLVARPRPAADAAKAVLVDGNDRCRAFFWHRSGKT